MSEDSDPFTKFILTLADTGQFSIDTLRELMALHREEIER